MEEVPMRGVRRGGTKTHAKIAQLKTQRKRGSSSTRQQGGTSSSERSRDASKGNLGRSKKHGSVVTDSTETLELDAEPLRIEAEMLRLKDEHFNLTKRAEEVKARKEASKALERFEVDIREELSDTLASLANEKREKLRAAEEFQREIKGRIGELEDVLSQLAVKIDSVNAMYVETASEVKR
jgi:cell fate (sporulation/competence/biofilm development) regulator YlbF (YheA/YmcA/DUF963 family)